MESNIKLFNDLDLHDIGVAEINLLVQSKEFELILDRYVEDQSGYIEEVIIFEEVKNILLPELNELYVEELFSADLCLTEKGHYKIKLVFLLGWGKPTWEISFDFSNVKILREGKIYTGPN